MTFFVTVTKCDGSIEQFFTRSRATSERGKRMFMTRACKGYLGHDVKEVEVIADDNDTLVSHQTSKG